MYYEFGLLDYLFAHHLPDSIEEQERIQRLAIDYRAYGKELQHQKPQHEGLPGAWHWANVPPARERSNIIKDTHDSLRHIG